MNLDKPGDTGSSADSSRPGDTISETGLNSHGRDNTPVADSARHHRVSRDAQFAGASAGLAGAADVSVRLSGADGAADHAGRDREGTGQDGPADGPAYESPAGPADGIDETSGATGQDAEGTEGSEAGGGDLGGSAAAGEGPRGDAPAVQPDPVPGLGARDAVAVADRRTADGSGDAGPDAGLVEGGRAAGGAPDAGVPEDRGRGGEATGKRDRPATVEQSARQGDAPADKEDDDQAREDQDHQSVDRQAARDQDGGETREKPKPVQEAYPDSDLDTGRDQAMEQLKAEIKTELKNDLKGELKEELKSELEAEHKAETDSLKVENQELRQQVTDLKAKVEEGEHERKTPPERAPETADQAEPSGTPDVIKPGDRSDAPAPEDDAGDVADESDKADIQGLFTGETGREEHKTEPTARKVFTVSNIGFAGSGLTLADAVGGIFAHMPPEVSAGSAALGFIGATMGASLVKDLYKKWKGRDER